MTTDSPRKASAFTVNTSVSGNDSMIGVKTSNDVVNNFLVKVSDLLGNSSINKLKLVSGNTPANSTANCVAGDLWTDGSYLYYAVANNSIARAALSSF